MKIKINKIVLFSIASLIFSVFSSNSYASISDKFKFVIDTIGIPRYNIYGEEINEEIYYRYNVFSYSTPEAMYRLNIGQRFKEVPIYGKWSENGKIGEHDFLGRGYSGQPISNVYFPVDSVPEVTPDKWNYIDIYGTWEAWYDGSRYKYQEQLEYMQNSKLLFDTINYNENKCDPYHLVEYNITAKSIGTGKVLLNTAATWKTYGVVTVNRIDCYGQKRYATLAIKPMAANAGVKSSFNCSQNLNINSNQDSIPLNLKFGCNAINLTDYAKPKHIKEIFSILYIDGVEVARVSGSKTVSVDKNIVYTVSRDRFPSPGENKIHIKVVSYLYTEFNVDGLMEDVLEKDLKIEVNEKAIVPVDKVNVYYQKNIDNKLVVSPLVQTNITKDTNSCGIVEKQRKIAVDLKLKEDIQSINSISVSIDNEDLESEILYKGDNNCIIGLEIPSDIDNTLCTWDYLRNKLGNYFDIDFNEIGNRIDEPKNILIKFKLGDKEYSENFKIDIVDDYQKNVNYIFDKNVLNKQEIDNIYKLEDL